MKTHDAAMPSTPSDAELDAPTPKPRVGTWTAYQWFEHRQAEQQRRQARFADLNYPVFSDNY
jgi:hypothetical protein